MFGSPISRPTHRLPTPAYSPVDDDGMVLTPPSENASIIGSVHIIFGQGGAEATERDPVVSLPELAPVEEWMDREGVLSLYPLAVHASHQRQVVTGPRPAAGPLFGPTLAMRRKAKEKEWERLIVRGGG